MEQFKVQGAVQVAVQGPKSSSRSKEQSKVQIVFEQSKVQRADQGAVQGPTTLKHLNISISMHTETFDLWQDSSRELLSIRVVLNDEDALESS